MTTIGWINEGLKKSNILWWIILTIWFWKNEAIKNIFWNYLRFAKVLSISFVLIFALSTLSDLGSTKTIKTNITWFDQIRHPMHFLFFVCSFVFIFSLKIGENRRSTRLPDTKIAFVYTIVIWAVSYKDSFISETFDNFDHLNHQWPKIPANLNSFLGPKERILRAVPVVKWLVCWAFNQAISFSIPGRTKSVTITLSRHLCASPHVGHTRRIRSVLKYRITDLEA